MDIFLSVYVYVYLYSLYCRLDGGALLTDGSRYKANRANVYNAKYPAKELTLNTDRGPSMKSKVVAHLLADLGSRGYKTTQQASCE